MTGAVAWRGQDVRMNACKCFSALAGCCHLIDCGFCGGVRGQLPGRDLLCWVPCLVLLPE